MHKLFKLKGWDLQVEEEAWGFLPFKAILDRDKTEDKTKALKEMLFIYHYCDIRSIYEGMSDAVKTEEIKKDIGLPKSWKVDKVIKEGIRFYSSHQTVLQRLYGQLSKAAAAIGDYLENTEALLAERDNHGKPVTDIAKITASIQKAPKLMADIKAAYKEVVKEQEEIGNKKKGSRTYNTYEKGLEFEE